jgi:hypothetical protein
MFTEALDALRRFVAESAGVPVYVRTAGPAAVGSGAAGVGSSPPDAAPGADAAAGANGGPAVALSLRLVSVTRSDRPRSSDREVIAGGNGNGATVRPGPRWYDLVVAIEPEGDALAGADALERVLSATIRTRGLATALAVGDEYPAHAVLDALGHEELEQWRRSGVGGRSGAVLSCVLTLAVQPFEPVPTGIVATRRVRVEDRRTHAADTVER